MERAVSTESVLALANALGAEVDRAEVLWDGANVVLRLGDALIARVATATGASRGRDAPKAMWRSILVAEHLARSGIAAPRPSDVIDPGPHACGETWVTFWTHVDHDASREVEPAVAAHRLRALHEALSSLPTDDFVRLGPLEELHGMIETLRPQGEVEPAVLDAFESELHHCRGAIDALRLEEALIHGDASPGNLLRTPDGPIWSDFEDACIGPRAWDLACLVGTARAFDLPSRSLREAILEAYGSPAPDVLAPFVGARVIQALVWDAAITAQTGEGRKEARARRAKWLADEGGLRGDGHWG